MDNSIKVNTTADQSTFIKKPIENAPQFVDKHSNGERAVRKQILGAGNKKTESKSKKTANADSYIIQKGDNYKSKNIRPPIIVETPKRKHGNHVRFKSNDTYDARDTEGAANYELPYNRGQFTSRSQLA